VRSEPDVPCHAAGTPTHRNTAEGRRGEVHEAVIDCEEPHGHGAARKETVVFIGGGDDRIPERQRGLRNGKNEHAGRNVVPGKMRDIDHRQSHTGPYREQVSPQRRVQREGRRRAVLPVLPRDGNLASRIEPRHKWTAGTRSGASPGSDLRIDSMLIQTSNRSSRIWGKKMTIVADRRTPRPGLHRGVRADATEFDSLPKARRLFERRGYFRTPNG